MAFQQQLADNYQLLKNPLDKLVVSLQSGILITLSTKVEMFFGFCLWNYKFK